MKKAPKRTGPSRMSLREMPEVRDVSSVMRVEAESE